MSVKKHSILTLATILFVLIGCNRKTDNHQFEIIRVSINDNPLKSGNLFDSVSLYKMDEIVIGKVIKLIENDQLLYVLTSNGDYRVHIFDIGNKNLQKSIARLGRGPDEFLSVNDIYINSGNLFIHDFMGKKLTKYDLDGSIIEVIDLPDYADNVLHLDRETIVLFKKMKYGIGKQYKINIYNYENNFRLINNYLELTGIEEERDFSSLNNLYTLRNRSYFPDLLNNKIYELYPDSISARYELTFGDYQLPEEVLYNKNLDLVQLVGQLRENEFVWNVNNFMENNKYIFFTFIFKNENFFSFYDKTSNTISTYKSFINDLSAYFEVDGISSMFYPVSINDTAMYFVAEPTFLSGQFEQTELLKDRTDYDNANLLEYNNLDLMDNPILIKFYFADN